MPSDVFISYSSKDKSVADAMTAALEGRGVRCWVAPRDIQPGQHWGEAIIDAIGASRIMVLIYSAHSNVSPQVQREVERAVSGGLHIVPFRIDAAPLSKVMQYFISTPHWLDAMTSPLEKHLGRLAETVAAVLGATSDTARPLPRATSAAVRLQAPSGRRAGPLVAGAVLLLVSVAAAVWILRRPRVESSTTALATSTTPAVSIATSQDVTVPVLPSTTSPGVGLSTPPVGTPPATRPATVDARQLRVLEGHHGGVIGVSFAADGRLFSLSESSVVLLDKSHAAVVREYKSKGYPASLSPEGATIAVLEDQPGAAPQLGLHDSTTGALLGRAGACPPGHPQAATFSPDGKLIAVSISTADKSEIRAARTGQLLRSFADRSGGTSRAGIFSPDGIFLLRLDERGQILYDIGRGGEVWTSSHPCAGAAVFSADGKRILLWGDGGEGYGAGDGVNLCDAKNGRRIALVHSSDLPDRFTTGAAFVQAGELFLTCSDAGLRLWDLNGDAVSRFPTTGPLLQICLSPDGHRVATAGADGHVRLFDVGTGQPLADLTGHNGPVLSVAFSIDGRLLASGGHDKTVRLWQLPD